MFRYVGAGQACNELGIKTINDATKKTLEDL
jgi:hypothetical protein